MREEVANGDRADEIDFLYVGWRCAALHTHFAERREKLGHRIEQLESALFVEGHERDTDNWLRHGVDAKDGVRRERGAALAVLPADLLTVNDLAAPGQHGTDTG